MAPPAEASFRAPADLLSSFRLTRVLSNDQRVGVAYLLGTAVPTGHDAPAPAILKVEKTPYDLADVPALSEPATWDRLHMVTANDIYATILAWYAPGPRSADLQLSSICPATEKHIRKYSEQSSRLVRETPELYKAVVEPYINSLPTGQINWVYNILEGKSEAENVVLRVRDPELGFVLTPDLKWDQKTLSSMYLLVLTETRAIRSLRDLRRAHLPLLRRIRTDVERAVVDKYGIEMGELRMFIHYQPTYYHFHVHVTHLSYVGFQGITVGQAHLLDDVIDNLELDDPAALPSYYERRTLTYALGTEHALYRGLAAGALS